MGNPDIRQKYVEKITTERLSDLELFHVAVDIVVDMARKKIDVVTAQELLTFDSRIGASFGCATTELNDVMSVFRFVKGKLAHNWTDKMMRDKLKKMIHVPKEIRDAI